ncbi:27839_t:CDS:2, partial [Dentiscutata erythropus]
ESTTKRIGHILSIVQKNGSLNINIQRILTFEKLPRKLQSNSRRERSRRGEVWMLDREIDNAIIITKLQAIIKHIKVTILYDNNIMEDILIVIREILYKHNNKWKLRNITYSYKHPSENDINEVYSLDKYIKISLKKQILRRNIKESILSDFKEQIELLLYNSRYLSVDLSRAPSFFKYASFFIEKNNNPIQCCLYVGDFISINFNEDEIFSIVHAIFGYKKNGYYFAFIIIDLFKYTKQIKLECPVYKLRTNNLRRIFSVSMVNITKAVHFVHNHKDDQCVGRNHYFAND